MVFRCNFFCSVKNSKWVFLIKKNNKIFPNIVCMTSVIFSLQISDSLSKIQTCLWTCIPIMHEKFKANKKYEYSEYSLFSPKFHKKKLNNEINALVFLLFRSRLDRNGRGQLQPGHGPGRGDATQFPQTTGPSQRYRSKWRPARQRWKSRTAWCQRKTRPSQRASVAGQRTWCHEWPRHAYEAVHRGHAPHSGTGWPKLRPARRRQLRGRRQRPWEWWTGRPATPSPATRIEPEADAVPGGRAWWVVLTKIYLLFQQQKLVSSANTFDMFHDSDFPLYSAGGGGGGGKDYRLPNVGTSNNVPGRQTTKKGIKVVQDSTASRTTRSAK